MPARNARRFAVALVRGGKVQHVWDGGGWEEKGWKAKAYSRSRAQSVAAGFSSPVVIVVPLASL